MKLPEQPNQVSLDPRLKTGVCARSFITSDELQSCDYVVKMGCSTLDVGEIGSDVDVRDWALDDPDGEDLERVREIRDEIEQRVITLFDELRPSD